MSDVDFRTAVALAIGSEMERDDTVLLLGEDVGYAGGVFQATRGLFAQFGPDRVVDTAISELALAGAAFGAAISGLRPIIEIMFGDFLPLAMDSLVNQAAKYWYVSNGQAGVPLVVRSAVGGGAQFGAIHSQIPASWLMSVPGLKIVAPSTPADAHALLGAAIRDDNPVVFLEHKRLYGTKGPLTAGDGATIGSARIARPGRDVTLVSVMHGVLDCLAAADELAADGIDAEVIDLRTLRPLDLATLAQSVGRTGRLLVVEEGPITGGWAAEVLTSVRETGVAVEWAARLATPDLPLPYSTPIEAALLPNAAGIAGTVLNHLQVTATEVV